MMLHKIICLLFIISSLMSSCAINPVESIIYLILCFCIAGATLFMFNAELLALIYIIVYVGAVAILFLFIIMMIDVKVRQSSLEALIYGKNKVFLLLIVSSYPIGFYILNILGKVVVLSEKIEMTSFYDELENIEVFAEVLFNYYTVHFLFAGIILLISLIGCIISTMSNPIHSRS
jgi:NADH-quinone oxidoreductase subunit J